MLDPKTPIALLPQDREIMDILDLSEAEYRAFCLECRRKSVFRPGEPLAFELVTFAVTLLVGIALSAISAMLAPKQQEPEEAKLEESTVDGQDIIRKDRFAPKSGFDSVQNVVNLGSVVPIVYAKRETLGSNQYGGIRVNTNLLWSQLQSIGGGQFFRGIFMVGEASNVPGVSEGPIIDFAQTALGNNTLGSYYLKANQEAGRATIYYSPGNGRIEGGDPGAYYELGVIPDNDPGNKARPELPESERGADVYCIESDSETPTGAFCQAIIPSNQSTFGVYGFCANRFAFKLGERFEALTQWQARKDGEYERQDSNQKVCQNYKDRDQFACRAGFVAATDEFKTVAPGDLLTYQIFRSSDLEHKYYASGSTSGGEEPSEIGCEDVATTVASLQRGYDERINVGDLYRAGSALVICTSRSAEPFESDADVQEEDSGRTVSHQFEVVEGGQVHVWEESRLENGPNESNGKTATESSHLLQTAIASFALERPARTIEIGFKSALGVKSSGIANFNSLTIPSSYSGEYDQYQEYVDSEFCGGQENGDNPKDESYRKEILPGKYSSTDDRYSFFLIQFRDSDQSDFTTVDKVFGIRSQTSQAVYNYLRIRFPSSQRREMRFVPISGWEVRNSVGYAISELCILDPHVEAKVEMTSNGVEFVFNGIQGLARTSQTLGINAFANLNTGKTQEIESITIQNPGSGYPADLINRGDISLVPSSAGSTTGSQAKCRINTDASGVVLDIAVTRSGDDYSVGDSLTLSTTDLGFDSKDNKFEGTAAIFTVAAVDGSERQPIGTTGNADDGAYYVDAFARIAEAFWYSEVSNSASQPEHSISYVNIIDDNDTTPLYDSMAIVGLNIRSTKEIGRLDQVSVYVERGVIDSHLFPDVFTDLLTNPVYGVGGFFDVAQIDAASFLAASQWTETRRYFFDGAVTEKLNLRTWGSDRASDFLLDLAISGGKFKLQPVANFDGPEVITALFTSGNILEDSFEMSFFDIQDRIPPRVSVKWREERASLSIADNGLFPRIREVLVSRNDTPADAPEQTVDMSDFCTNERHAIDRAKWLILQKLYITNAVKFSTVPTQAGIQVGSVIKVGVETRRYEQPHNGSIGPDGQVTFYPSLGNGEYPVIIWDGETYQETVIQIEGGVALERRNCVFCLRDLENVAETYKVQKVAFNEDGNLDVEAVYWPVDDTNTSRLVTAFADANFTFER